MSLELKRLAHKVQNEDFPAFQTELQQLLGYAPSVEVAWDTFTAHDAYPLTRLTGVVFKDLKNALSQVAKDDFGKQALQAGLTAIHLENTDDKEQYALKFEDKTLFLRAQLTQSTMHAPTAAVVRDLIEKNL
jgi:hypothetical protein